jgi:hypothetical protein
MRLEYLAGIVDGEGHFGRYNNKNGAGRTYAQSLLVIVNTHEPLIDAIRKRFGGYKRAIPLRQRPDAVRKQCYEWRMTGKKCEALAAKLRPHLIVKAEQVKRVLDY